MNFTVLARQLRSKSTKSENYLWRYLRRRQIAGYKFRRQCCVGNYIVDFVCFEKMVIIELDGSQHLQDRDKDRQRDNWLEQQGYTVLRYWNDQVFKETGAVLEQIHEVVSGK